MEAPDKNSNERIVAESDESGATTQGSGEAAPADRFEAVVVKPASRPKPNRARQGADPYIRD